MKVEGNQPIWVRFNFSSSLYLPTSLGTFPGRCSKEQEPLSTTSTISFVRSGDKILISLCSSLFSKFSTNGQLHVVIAALAIFLDRVCCLLLKRKCEAAQSVVFGVHVHLKKQFDKTI